MGQGNEGPGLKPIDPGTKFSGLKAAAPSEMLVAPQCGSLRNEEGPLL